MKKIESLLIRLLLPCFLFACNVEESEIIKSEKGKEVSFSLLSLTKTSYDGFKTTFSDGDKIGVYAVIRNEGETATLKPSGNYADNLPFRYNESSNSFTAERESVFFASGQVMDFYYYYPYREIVPDATALPHTTGLRQDNGREYQTSDFMIGKTISYKDNSSPVALSFKHIMAQLEITINKIDGFPVEKVEITNRKNQCRINLFTEESTVIDKKEDITFYPFSETNKEYKFRVLLPAQNIEKEEDLFIITVSGSNVKYYRNSLINIDLLSGKITSYNITLQSRIHVTATEGGTVNVNLPQSGENIYNDGQEIKVEAIPKTGYKFSFWRENGREISTENPYFFITKENRSIEAVFEPAFIEIRTSEVIHFPIGPTNDSGGNYVIGKGTYPLGTEVTLQAYTAFTYKFLYWEDGSTVPRRKIIVGVDNPVYVAYYEKEYFTIEVKAEPRITESKFYKAYYGSSITVDYPAAPNGWRFVRWGWLEGNSTDAQYTIDFVEGDMIVTAYYQNN